MRRTYTQKEGRNPWESQLGGTSSGELGGGGRGRAQETLGGGEGRGEGLGGIGGLGGGVLGLVLLEAVHLIVHPLDLRLEGREGGNGAVWGRLRLHSGGVGVEDPG